MWLSCFSKRAFVLILLMLKGYRPSMRHAGKAIFSWLKHLLTMGSASIHQLQTVNRH
jgi:16S rRNA G966 N2-methylase RsmD